MIMYTDQQMYSCKNCIPLDKKEAIALYSTGIENNCPYKYYSSKKKCGGQL